MAQGRMRPGEVGQAGIRGALQLLEPSQVLLLAQGAVFSIQGPLLRSGMFLEGQLQGAVL